jgi:hypothetical protein
MPQSRLPAALPAPRPAAHQAAAKRARPALLLLLAIPACAPTSDGQSRQQAMWRTFDGGAAPTKDWRPYSRYQPDSPREDQQTNQPAPTQQPTEPAPR